MGTGDAVGVAADPVPAMQPDERLAGGAAVLQRQLEEPFSAFVHGRLAVNDAAVLASDVEASNGVIHVIDRVLLPNA